jgi:hypothetical protein
MINDFVLEYAKKPGFNRGTASETVFPPEGGQKGLLDQVFGDLSILDAEQRIAKKRITMLVYPGLRIFHLILLILPHLALE